jgi:hypothetical protein
MRWFKERERSPFPADMLRRLDRFGRQQYDPLTSGVDATDIWQTCAAPFYPFATADRDGFLTALQAVVAGDRSGFATYGAARLVWEFFSGDALTVPAAWPLIDAGITFKRDRGMPMDRLTGYEQQRLADRAVTPSGGG